MVVVINSISRCAGATHVTVSATVAGQAHTQTFLRSDLDLDPDGVPAAIMARLRSAVKEAGATTAAQVSAALVGKTFQV